MKTKTSWTSRKTGELVTGYYEDVDDFSLLPVDRIKSVCAFCVYKGKFILVKNEGNWEPVAGHVEKGESPEDALIREVKEESNMKVHQFFPMGYLYTDKDDIYQTRYFCLVEPYGDFIKDPDGGVTEIQLFNFEDIPKFLTWKDTAELTLNRCKEFFDNLKIDKKV